MKRILLIGPDSYIGSTCLDRLSAEPEKYTVDTIGVWDDAWQDADFSPYDSVLDFVGVAHVKETDENRPLYDKINRDLTIRLAQKARDDGARQFVLMSTMSVYGLTEGHVTKDTVPAPTNAYGRSKLAADEAIEALAGDGFRFACLRPPMVYGRGCKGNYQRLRSLALKSPVFPKCANRRSMIYVGNLCEFILGVIDGARGGLFFPQNAEPVNTAEMVRLIAEANGKRIRLIGGFSGLLGALPVGTVRKVFGTLTYDPVDTVDQYGFEESILLSEGRAPAL